MRESSHLTRALSSAAIALGRTREADEVVRVAVAETQRVTGIEAVALHLLDRKRCLASISGLHYCACTDGARQTSEPSLTPSHFSRPRRGRPGRSVDMSMKPLHDRVMVKRLEEREVKKGGIIIPDTAKEKPQEGEVIAVGPGKVTQDGKRQPMEVKAGDKVLFGKWSGNEVKLGDEEYLIMREEDILAILQ
jgi:chaperonin GroES